MKVCFSIMLALLLTTIGCIGTAAPALKITYQLKLAPKSELKKQPHKRKNQVHLVTLAANLDWDAVRAQFLVKIEECLKLKKLDLLDYNISFTVPRKISDSTPLSTDEDYDFLLKNVAKCTYKTASVYICAMKVNFMITQHVDC